MLNSCVNLGSLALPLTRSAVVLAGGGLGVGEPVG